MRRKYIIAALFSACLLANAWTNTALPDFGWISIASSADGTRLTATANPQANNPGAVYISVDSGPSIELGTE